MKTDQDPKSQSVEDKAVLAIKKCANGYTVRVESQTWVYTSLADVLDHVKRKFEP